MELPPNKSQDEAHSHDGGDADVVDLDDYRARKRFKRLTEALGARTLRDNLSETDDNIMKHHPAYTSKLEQEIKSGHRKGDYNDPDDTPPNQPA